MDTDMKCVQPIDDLIAGARLVVAAIYIAPGTRAFAINNAFIACVPGAPEVAKLLQHVATTPGVGSQRMVVVRINESAGPVIWTRILHEATRAHADTAASEDALGVRVIQPGVVDLLCPPELQCLKSWCAPPPAAQHIQVRWSSGELLCL